MIQRHTSTIGVMLLVGWMATDAGAQEWPPVIDPPVVAEGYTIVEKHESQWRDNAWKDARRWEYAYDEAGRLTQETMLSWFSDTWRTGRQTTRTYDAEGLCTEQIMQESLGKRMKNHARHTYSYSDGRLTQELVEGWSYEEKWVLLFRHDFAYDDEGRQVEVVKQQAQGNLMRYIHRITTAYDSTGRVLQYNQERHHPAGGWIPGQRISFQYDEAGRRTEMLMQSASDGDGEWIDALKLIYTYDDAGRPVEILSQLRSREGLADSGKRTLAYDAAGNQTENTSWSLRDGQWVKGLQERYITEGGS